MKSLQFLLVCAIIVSQVFSQRFGQQSRYQSNYNNPSNNYNNYDQNNNYKSNPNYNVRDIPQVPQRFSGSCPEKDGRYPTSTCDGYIECKDGIPEDKVCPDGLLFNAASGPQAYPCQYPTDVDCSGREQTQPAQSTDDCPHQFGYYRIGDSNNCGQFKNCVDGRAFVFDCPEGLAFNDATYRCDWPDKVDTCNAEAYLGFTCPPEAKGLGQGEHKFFRSPSDCQRYFVCVENRPRLYNCGEGKAFNDLTNACDGVENVTGCAGPQYNNDYRGIQTPLSYDNNQYTFRG